MDSRYGCGRTIKGHSEQCRTRIAAKLQETPAGRERIRAAESRLDHAVAAQGEEILGGAASAQEEVRQGLPPQQLPVFEKIPDGDRFRVLDEVHPSAADQQPQNAGSTPNADMEEQHRGQHMGMEERNHDDNDEEAVSVQDGADNADMDMGMMMAAASNSVTVSHMGLAPVPDDGSQRVQDEDAKRAPRIPKLQISGNWTREEKREILMLHNDIMQMVDQMGGDMQAYSKQNTDALRTVSEMYSAPRVTDAAKRMPNFKVLPGFALDITQKDERGIPWDFDSVEMRQKARAKVVTEKPMLVVGTPMCTAFSALLALSTAKRDPEAVKRQITRARVHLAFMCELYELQVRAGRYFLHEHPQAATSWQMEEVIRVLGLKRVQRVSCHQCQYGAEHENGQPIRKATSFMSNSPYILGELQRKCQGRHGQCSRKEGGKHALCMGRAARLAAIFPLRLCTAILRGFSKQLTHDGIIKPGSVGLHVVEEDCHVMNVNGVDEKMHSRKQESEVVTDIPVMSINGQKNYKDDLTGLPLDETLVRAAIEKELGVL